LKSIIKIIGTLFLIYLAYKNSLQNQVEEKKNKNPVTLKETFIFQFAKPKGVFAAITSISLFVELGPNYFISFFSGHNGVIFLCNNQYNKLVFTGKIF
jgi:hypothetical protein